MFFLSECVRFLRRFCFSAFHRNCSAALCSGVSPSVPKSKRKGEKPKRRRNRTHSERKNIRRLSKALCPDPRSPPYDGVIVQLRDAQGQMIATATTDSNGAYTFSGLAWGAYSLQFVLPTQATGFLTNTTGIDDPLERDVNEQGATAVFSLLANNPVTRYYTAVLGWAE
jgi:hypothetical protein